MKSIFITGASGGIGNASVKLFAARGWRVFAGVRNKRDGERLADGGRVTPLIVDVTDEDAVRAAAAEIESMTEGNGLQVVVNNAGLIINGPLELVPSEQLRQQLDVNVQGPVNVVQAMLPLLRKGHGRIVNISAPTARTPIPFMAPISASKAALDAISAALRIELALWSIPVVVVSPSSTNTEIFAKADGRAEQARALAGPELSGLYSRQMDALAAAFAKQRMDEPAAVAKVILRAAETRRPRTRYSVGGGARQADILGGLPDRLRDRLLTSALGLKKSARGT